MEERNELKQELGMLDVSLTFLLLILFAVLLSVWSALIQRREMAMTLEGREAPQTPSVYLLRQAGSAITVGCLGFFLCLALETQAKAQAEGDPAARQSARVNVLASLLVLLAAILRLKDLQATQQQLQTPLLEETTLPD